MNSRTPRWRTWLARLLQLAASVAVFWALTRDVDLGRIRAALADISIPLLLLAFGLKSIGLLLHEVRLWMALPPPRAPLRRVTSLGLAAGVLNLFLPARAGDVAAILFLRRECGVRTGQATAVVGIVGFLEAAVFGVVLLGVLVAGAARWELVIGADAVQQAMGWVSGVTLGGLAVAFAVGLLGRRLARASTPDTAPKGPSPMQLIRDALGHTGDFFTSPRALAANAAVALVQITGMVAGFAVCLPALGLDVAMPALAAAGVLAISSLASVVLPPTYGAGPAAASVAVLAVFGVDQAGALAFAAAWWLVSHVPAVALGLPCLWGRPIHLDELDRGLDDGDAAAGETAAP